jgi:hypothetical protein
VDTAADEEAEGCVQVRGWAVTTVHSLHSEANAHCTATAEAPPPFPPIHPSFSFIKMNKHTTKHIIKQSNNQTIKRTNVRYVQGRVTVAVDGQGRVCGILKAAGGGFPARELQGMTQVNEW